MRKNLIRAVGAALTILCAAACGKGGASASQATPGPTPPPAAAPEVPAVAGKPVQIEMRNVRLHADNDVILNVKRLRGEMISRSPGAPPVFDDSRSYVLRLAEAEVSMSMASVSALMNKYVFSGDGSPISDVDVKAGADGQLVQKGTLHKGVPLPFRTSATLSTTSDGRMKLHVESMKTMGIPAKGFLGLFGLKLGSLVKVHKRGVEVSGDDIIIAPGLVLPPPEMRGQLVSVAVVGDMLVQRFRSPDAASWPALTPPDSEATNYVYFSGSSIRFGKLTMSGSDLQLIDADASDAFDFFPAQYKVQLVAGFSLNTPSGGLKTYMPDYDEARRGGLAHPKDKR